MNCVFYHLHCEFVVGRGRGLGGQADVNPTPSLGSGEMRSVSVGGVGLARGIQSNFPDGSGQDFKSVKLVTGNPGRSKNPGTVNDVKSLRPTRGSRLLESCKERFDELSEDALLGKGQAGDVPGLTFPECSMTPMSVQAAILKPVEHELSLPTKPPENDQNLGSAKVDTIRSSVATPGVVNCEVLVISEYINPLESATPLGYDGEQPVMNSAATTFTPHASAVTAAFLPGVHHPQKDSKRPTEPVINFTFLK